MTDHLIIGIDLTNRKIHIRLLSSDGGMLERAEVPTTMIAMRHRFGAWPLAIAIEGDGASLRKLMRDGRLSSTEVLELIPQVCEALQSAHARSLVHRDIKPESILVDRDGRVSIADFGLARLQGLEPDGLGLSMSHWAFGSIYNMAPEQIRSAGGTDHTSNPLSLGLNVHVMLMSELHLGRFSYEAPFNNLHSGGPEALFAGRRP